ncbi:hypothetical protein ACIOHB_31600 [Streptomyces microflavus]
MTVTSIAAFAAASVSSVSPPAPVLVSTLPTRAGAASTSTGTPTAP